MKEITLTEGKTKSLVKDMNRAGLKRTEPILTLRPSVFQKPIKDMNRQNGRINIGKCNECGELPTLEGHDFCLGELPGLMNACCGHGDKESAYVQFLDTSCIRGKSACVIIEELKKGAIKPCETWD